MNMGLVWVKNLLVVFVGDIDCGGVLVSFFGIWVFFDDDDWVLLVGYIVNKFCGDDVIFVFGFEEIIDCIGMLSFGVLFWVLGVWFDGEDVLEVGWWCYEGDVVDLLFLWVVVVWFLCIFNVIDVDVMVGEMGVDV